MPGGMGEEEVLDRILSMGGLRYPAGKGPWGVNYWPDLPVRIRMYSRDRLAGLFAELGYRVGVEVGVYVGEFSATLCEANPEATIYSIDPWAEYVGGGRVFPQKKMDECHGMAVDRLRAYPNSVVWRMGSLEAVRHFDDNYLDFVYLDGAHDFDSAMLDIIHWSRKVRPGGIVAGHDWDRKECRVAEAVLGYTLAYRIDPWFVLGRQYDRGGTFMWVKPMEDRGGVLG